MKKKTNTGKPKTREEFACPYSHMSIEERLIMSKAVDLRNNFEVTKMGKYQSIRPIDPNKRFGY